MPLPTAPDVKTPRFLDMGLPLPPGTYAIAVTVGRLTSDTRVSARVEVCNQTGEWELQGTLKCGVATWRTFVLPGLRALCVERKVHLEVREVETMAFGGPPA